MSKKLYKIGMYEGTPVNTASDYMRACVVVANTPHQARLFASTAAGDEGKKVWLDPKKSFCHIIQPDKCDIGILVANTHRG
jgi:hypothetical protein